jgi:hypothetical protein
MKLNVAAETLEELEARLRALDLTVPARTDGRTTEHTETYTLARQVSTLAKHGDLQFPLAVRHRDRPDFLIESAGKEIGVEVTEAISEAFAAYSALADREFPEARRDMGLFRWDQPELSVAQMRAQLAQNRLVSDGWAGLNAEREWALWVERAVDRKLERMAKVGYGLFERNWLSTYDNLPLPNVWLQDAVAILRELLADRWSGSPRFDAVFVERGPMIVRITKEKTDQVGLHDVWDN